MNMELTNELKARFAALYYRQTVFCATGSNGTKIGPYPLDIINLEYFAIEGKTDYLELRPLSSITEEEIHRLCDLLWGDISYQDLYKLVFLNANADLQISNVAIDYLRSLGIATDYMGIPVDQWVEWGVVKLKEA